MRVGAERVIQFINTHVHIHVAPHIPPIQTLEVCQKEPEVLPARLEVCPQVPAGKHIGWHHLPLVTPADIGSLPTPGRGRGTREGAGLQLLVGGREIFLRLLVQSLNLSVPQFLILKREQ